ncbi:MAG: hypothetical protein IPK99_09960 [Flavobacteriales bacterium]|nr:hypothetical protein [Flavobacteriales bacterium]
MRDRSLSNWRGDAGSLYRRFAGRRLGIATMHGKERVIGPALMGVLPLSGFTAIPNADTDQFGAFSGEVQRTLDPLTTCIQKAKHGSEVSGLDLVIASEGSFGPYPPAPFIPCNEEILVLYDAQDDTFFQHKHLSLETVFGGERCSSLSEVMTFAERMKFPEHHLVLRAKEKWEPGDAVHKGIADRERLRALSGTLLVDRGSCWVETDMRAMGNLTRMRVIAETAERLAQELLNSCPACGECWFRITEALPGLPCELCGWPTQSVRAYRRSCRSCGYVSEVPRPDGKATEEPGHCQHCNP